MSEGASRVVQVTASLTELAAPFVGSLSPSRAADFKTCPLLYRLRTIDRLPEAPSLAATRGTVVHEVLERLYDLPAAERTVANAQGAVGSSWQRLLDQDPGLAVLFDCDEDGTALLAWLDSARTLVANYFELEDPRRLEPAEREQLIEVVLDGLRLRGYVDRLDVSPAGELRVVDYKTGAIPREAYEAKALFQMKFYALVLWRSRQVVPRQLRLIYLADRETLSFQADEDELVRFERTLHAIWKAVARATETRDFRPSPSRLCDWCSYHQHCPSQGGTLPPFPEAALSLAAEDRRRPSVVEPEV
jgi:putative RecB family exonuclease